MRSLAAQAAQTETRIHRILLPARRTRPRAQARSIAAATTTALPPVEVQTSRRPRTAPLVRLRTARKNTSTPPPKQLGCTAAYAGTIAWLTFDRWRYILHPHGPATTTTTEESAP